MVQCAPHFLRVDFMGEGGKTNWLNFTVNIQWRISYIYYENVKDERIQYHYNILS
jgi:hypothetical protein